MKALWRFFIAISLFPACNYSSITRLPDFRISLADGRQIPVSEKIEGKSAILIHFDPDCSGCQQEASMIARHHAEFKDVPIIFMSEHDTSKIRLFDEVFGLSRHPNITVARDTANSLAVHFQDYTTPLLVITNKEREVHAVITGEAELPDLLKYLHETE